MVDAVVMRAIQLMDARRPDRAAEVLATHLAEHPDDVDALTVAAMIALQREDAATARRLAEHALVLAPDSAETLAATTRIRDAIGDHAGALESARRRITLFPDDASAHADVAMLTAPGDRYGLRGSGAAEREARRLAPDDADVAAALAAARRMRGDPKRASRDYRALLARDPGDRTARLGLAGADRERGASVAALRGYLRLAREDGMTPDLVDDVARAAATAMTRVAATVALLEAPLLGVGQVGWWRAVTAAGVGVLLLAVTLFVGIRLGRDTRLAVHHLVRSERRISAAAVLLPISVAILAVSVPLPEEPGRLVAAVAWGASAVALGLAVSRPAELWLRAALVLERRARAVGRRGPILGTVIVWTVGVVILAGYVVVRMHG